MKKPIECRFLIDQDMGEFYQWVQSLGSRTRSREVLYLARLGHAFATGKAVQQASTVGPAVNAGSAQDLLTKPSETEAPVEKAKVAQPWTMEALNVDRAFFAGPTAADLH
jgi:hypothetical protein